MGIVKGIKECLAKVRGRGIQAYPIATEITLKQQDEDVNYKFANFQHIGRREQQEDAFGFSNIGNQELLSTKGFMAIVADGMGGLSSGNVASQMVVEGMLKGYESLDSEAPIASQLMMLVQDVNQGIYEMLHMEGGSTLAGVYILGQNLYWMSVGDSRIYLKRGGRLYQVNEDHVYLSQLYEKVFRKELKKEEADSDTQKAALTEYMGKDSIDRMDISLRPFKLEMGDKLLVCSDGVYGSLTEEVLSTVLELEIAEACTALQEQILIKNLPYQDNLTGLLIAME